MTTQLASAAGIHVISIVGAHNFEFSKQCGAAQVFDHKDPSPLWPFLHLIWDYLPDSASHGGNEVHAASPVAVILRGH